MFFAICIDFRLGKGGVTPTPEKLEPAPIAVHYRLDELQNTVSGINITGPQLETSKELN
jgi:hypothetical protein